MFAAMGGVPRVLAAQAQQPGSITGRVTDAASGDAVGRAHGSVFGDVRPAATLVVVAGLLDPRMLVEVEVEAYVGGRPRAIPI